jgi:cyanophycinase-like exopeptidase
MTGTLCIMGSGETAPTMAPVHRALLERVGGGAARAVLIDTPFGFQENADELVTRTQEHFRRSIGHDLDLASLRDAERATELERERAYTAIAGSDYIFAGPGSPSYALRQWRQTEVPRLLEERLLGGACLTFASAAAISLGIVSLPVYEIYKVGEAVRWLEGLDVLGAAGVRAAVVTHWDNAEGGTHDTRFCYMGERRLRRLDELLPEGAAILGVDEHTALILDLDRGRVEVRGRGRAVVRRRGEETALPAGTEVDVGELRALLTGARAPRGAGAQPGPMEERGEPSDRVEPFSALLGERQDQFDQAADGSDPSGMVAAILALDSSLAEWSGETFSGDERDRARGLLRRMVTRLGESASLGSLDPREGMAPLVEAILGLRREWREQRRFADADRLRDLLAAAGVEVHDGRPGEPTGWELTQERPSGR